MRNGQASPSFAGVTARSLRTPSVAVTETRHGPGDRIAPHGHDRAFVTLVVEGGYVERCAGREDECDAGVAVLHRDGEVHEDRFGRLPSRLINVEWSRELAALADVSWGRVRAGRTMATIMSALDRELSIDDASSTLSVDELAAELVVAAREEIEVPDKAPRWLLEVVDRVRNEYRAPLDLASLADGADVHKSHLARAFRGCVGMTVGEYVRRLRIEWSKARLCQGVPLSEVALGAGFADQSHFTRWFRALTGVSPGRWAQESGRSGEATHDS